MPKLLFKLEEETATDIRSKEKAYKLTIENVGTKAVDLLSLMPNIPSNVELSEIKNPTFVALKRTHDEICEQLTQILNDYLITQHLEFQQKFVKTVKPLIEQATDFGGGFQNYLIKLIGKIFSGSLVKSYTDSKKSLRAYTEELENVSQAKGAFNRWFKDSTEVYQKNIFQSKLEELERIQVSLRDSKANSLATIEPDSSFSQTYVFKFNRNNLTPKKYNISVDGTYSQGNDNRIYSGSATEYLTISPNPIQLTIIAIIASILGAVLRYYLDPSEGSLFFPISAELFQNALNSTATAQFFKNSVIASIISLIFFNIYEYSSVGKNLIMGLSWRSALLIGALCGLFSDKFLAAFKAFIS